MSTGTGHHHHHGGAGFDWDAAADALEADGTMALPLVAAVLTELEGAGVEPARVTHVVDAGCGPGVIACDLARLLPAATVTGIDSAPELLRRLQARAARAGVQDRVRVAEADLDHALPALPPADLVWASMVVHHAHEPAAALGRLRDLLRPGGTLVVIEHAGNPRALPDSDPLVTGGAWRRYADASETSLADRLGLDAIRHDWRAELAGAGLSDVTERVASFRHEAPLGAGERQWLARHVRRGIDIGAERLDAADVAALEAFADEVEAGLRPDCFVEARRRLLTARRPAA